MTTAKNSSADPGPARGRGLDALFEGTVSPEATNQSVDADLAALLDNEIMAAETGSSLDVAGGPPSVAAVTEDVAPSALDDEPLVGVDLPPVAAEAQPILAAEPESISPTPVAPASAMPPPTPEPQPERRLPTTQRFGAIIMDTAIEPMPVRSEAPSDALVPIRAETKSILPPESGEEPAPPAPPAPPERTEDQKTIIIQRMDAMFDQGWQKALHQQIDDLYKQVATEFSSPPEKAERALSLLREARQVLLETPEEYVSAEYRTMQVRAMLDRVRESRKQSGYYGPRILVYETGWLVFFLAGLILAAPLARWLTLIAQTGVANEAALLNIYPILNTMIWGGIGGVVGALYSLWWHISEQQDFDRHYLTWYLVQPLLGLVLGGIVFLLMAGGFLLLQVNLQDPNAATAARLLPYLTAVLAGFRQNFVYEQFNRLMALFTPAPRSGNGGEGPGA
jgi:hypothetical protein